MGENEQETQMKAVLIQEKIEQKNGNIEKFHQKTSIVTYELDSQKVLLSRVFFARGPGSWADVSST